MDPEPGRCRRTDGKKWRCSRDIVAGQKYCERHMHRGRNRSRKPVEIPTPVTTTTSASPGGIFKAAGSFGAADATSLSAVAGVGGSHFSLSGSSPSSSIDLFHLDQGYDRIFPLSFTFGKMLSLEGTRIRTSLPRARIYSLVLYCF